MKYKKILVVNKKPLLDIYKKKSKKELNNLIAAGWDMNDLEAEVNADRLAKKTVKDVLRADKDVNVDWKYRAYLSKKLIDNYDLIISFGGDGTLIEASHYIIDKPVLGVNSDYRPEDPGSSEGFFLAANRHNFEEQYNKLKKGKISEHKFTRFELELNDKKLDDLVLNDILIAHSVPAATSRMVVKDKGIEEFQKSSGLVVATAASNWAVKIGGIILPIEEELFQYCTREIYLGRLNPNPKLDKGVTDMLEIYSKMRQGLLYVDGVHVKYPFGLGDKLKVTISDKPLRILGFDEEKREKYYCKT